MTDRALALVTGASSGIGEAFAHALAARGFDMIVVARRADRLASLAQRLHQTHGVEIRTVQADLATPKGIEETLRAVESSGRPLDLLINNAGVGSYGAFSGLEASRELQMVDLNVRAIVALTHHVLPRMIARGKGDIVQIASTTAFQPVPYMATYGATKAFVLHFSEAIAREVQGTGVRVLAVCPGHTPTEFQEVSGSARRSVRTTKQPAEQVVQEALEALQQGRHVVITGRPNRALAQVSRVLPRRSMTWVIGRGFKPR